jgi:Spy/CpxP family protein refolding chaperone
MLKEARALGAAIVDRERGLDRLFASGEADDAALTPIVSEIARLQGALRATHLRAHVEMRRILSPEQLERYVTLRGY